MNRKSGKKSLSGVEKAISRIVDDDDKVYEIMQVIEAQNYKSPSEKLHTRWSDDNGKHDKEEGTGTCTVVCRNVCWDPLCCCVKCGSGSFFCMIGLGIMFFILYWGARFAVYMYKSE